MFYSVEKFDNGGCVVFAHCTFGILPIISFPTQEALGDFILMLQEYQEKPGVPDEFRKAFEDFKGY